MGRNVAHTHERATEERDASTMFSWYGGVGGSIPAHIGISPVTKIVLLIHPNMYILIPYMEVEGGGGVQPILKRENVRHVCFLNPALETVIIGRLKDRVLTSCSGHTHVFIMSEILAKRQIR